MIELFRRHFHRHRTARSPTASAELGTIASPSFWVVDIHPSLYTYCMSVRTENLFPTLILQGSISGASSLNSKLLSDVQNFSREDKMGRQWSQENYIGGYTSYASLSDMHRRSPAFSEFEEKMQPHAEAFSKAQKWETNGLSLQMTACWINIMPKNTYHTLHLHPHSVISGSYYLSVPKGSTVLKLEDPRMSFYMNAPLRKGKSLYFEIAPRPGNFVLFESWLRHEVPPNQSKEPRISISFNYSLEEEI
jgi:uncharacterized protein (TIGR02466 family)